MSVEYAIVGPNGVELKIYADPLPPGQMRKIGALPVVVDRPDFNPETHRMLDIPTIEVLPDSVIKRFIVVRLAPEEAAKIARDTVIDRRRQVFPDYYEALETVTRTLARLIAWVDMQAEPGNPATILSDLPQKDRDDLTAILARCEANVLPSRKI